MESPTGQLYIDLLLCVLLVQNICSLGYSSWKSQPFIPSSSNTNWRCGFLVAVTTTLQATQTNVHECYSNERGQTVWFSQKFLDIVTQTAEAVVNSILQFTCIVVMCPTANHSICIRFWYSITSPVNIIASCVIHIEHLRMSLPRGVLHEIWHFQVLEADRG